jgi:hypothetical protein
LPEVSELNKIADWFEDRGLLLVFTARGIGIGESVSSWTHSANLIDPAADKLVLRIEAPTRLEAVRNAKAKWIADHAEVAVRSQATKSLTPEVAERVEQLREHHIHLVVSRASEAEDAAWMAEAYDQDANLVAMAVQPTLDDLWLTIAEDVLPSD